MFLGGEFCVVNNESMKYKGNSGKSEKHVHFQVGIKNFLEIIIYVIAFL